MKSVHQIVDEIYEKYWIGYPSYVKDATVNKTVFEIEMLQRSLGEIKDKSVIDVGGGWGIFAATCAALGMNTILLDDFGDVGKSNLQDPRHTLPSDFGFSVMQRDILSDDSLDMPSESIDAITTFDMLEHLHHSPKGFLHNCMRILRPNGILFIGVPNCVNLRKRLSIPFGRGAWSHFSEWYEPKVFRGHVREPDIQDLKRIAQDLLLSDYQIFGKNWQGIGNPSRIIRVGTKISNKIISYFPSICADIYLLGFKR